MSASIILLCEDLQTESFVRRFLLHRNFRGRDVLTVPIPGGKQSGEQWVRTSYPDQLRAIRRRQKTVLLVVIDADTNTTSLRRRQLNQECRRRQVTPISTDPVIIVIPKRNIETWFHFLKHQTPVDETVTYRKLNRASDCHPLADELHRICHERQRLPDFAPPSLKEACLEYPKLTRFLR